MAPTARIQNPIDDFVCHGIKTVGEFNYYLYVDGLGHAYIQRETTDSTDSRFVKMLDVEGSFADKATAIDTFWTAPEDVAKVYTYLFQC